jgi:hypothetical protein
VHVAAGHAPVSSDPELRQAIGMRAFFSDEIKVGSRVSDMEVENVRVIKIRLNPSFGDLFRSVVGSSLDQVIDGDGCVSLLDQVSGGCEPASGS